jgi:hypothetical protein
VNEFRVAFVYLGEVGMLVHDLAYLLVFVFVLGEERLNGDFRETKKLNEFIFFRLEVIFNIKVIQVVLSVI